ncbi:MAG: ABC transporter permease [Chthonomonas sp.]|nr:ABC transporter permease [Chthonomonas sp.]
MLRDRRVIVGVFVMPAIVLLLMFQMFGAIGNSIESSVKETTLGIVKGTTGNRMITELQAAAKSTTNKDGFKPKIIEVENAAEARALVESGKAKYVLEFPADYDQASQIGQATIKTYFDSGQETSEIAVNGMERWIETQNKAALVSTLEAASIPQVAMERVKLERIDVAKKGGFSGSILVSMLPYLLILFAFIGGMSVVADLVAGEKERGTMETLLISPASRREIAMGKFMALSLVSFLSVCSIVAGLVLTVVLGMGGGKMMFPEGAGLTPGVILTIIAVLIPQVLAFSGIMLAISALAKNMREAQTYLGIANFVVVTPAVFSQMIGFTDLSQALWIKLTPVLNTAMVIRNALLNKPDQTLIVLTVISSLVLAAIGFILTIRMFQKESILARV